MSWPVTALLLPGQGSQRAGMGQAWVGTPQWEIVTHASAVLGVDLAGLLLDADASTLQRTDVAQIATHLVSLMAMGAVRERIGPISLLAGHSLGEYPALVGAGVLDLESSVRLVAARGRAMAAAADLRPGSMAAVLGLPAGAVTEVCAQAAHRGQVWPAAYNAASHVVIAGTAQGLASVSVTLRERGARRILALPVGGAFHTPLMASAAPALTVALTATVWGPATVPVIANVDALPHLDGWVSRCADQLLSPVLWSQTMAQLSAHGVERVIECGPGGVLRALAKAAPGLTAQAVAGSADLDQLR